MNNITLDGEQYVSNDIDETLYDFIKNAVGEVHLQMEKAKVMHKLKLVIEYQQMFIKMFDPSELETIEKTIKKYRKRISTIDSQIIDYHLLRGMNSINILDLDKTNFLDMINTIEECIECETTPMTLEQVKSGYNLIEINEIDRCDNHKLKAQ
ncbi:hypothetical protein C173_03259 [Paenibacillus sp. FSL R7-277]|uniref:hypothetical protein n=1 Tax=Paenibacillus sp. FSL R7-277 TaxID=1227352 RepID=UPI0003E1C70E|nr:hypothetical protein [Paenibacillus sp. FSL R7-277]ETT77501.1 hypothetical protein C173_03259 [Paenibacillus sp. FSL R7-277]